MQLLTKQAFDFHFLIYIFYYILKQKSYVRLTIINVS